MSLPLQKGKQLAIGNVRYITTVIPRVVDHARRREDLADAAVEVIAYGGLDAAGLREVARRSDVTTGALTHYFPAKAALLDAAYEAAMARLAVKQAATALDPAATADDTVALLATFLPTDPDGIRDWRAWLAFSARALVEPGLSARHRAHYARITATLAAELGDAPAADILVAALDGLAIRMLLEPGDWPAARVADTLHAVVTPLLKEPPS